MDRRGFIRLATVGSAASIIAPSMVLATPVMSLLQSPMAGGIYYTKDAPGRWSKKADGHYPHVSRTTGEDGKIHVRVLTQHEMKGFEHYIIKHILLDKNFHFLAENSFDPTKDKVALSSFAVSNYSGPVFALSVCNKHDTWMNVLEV